MTNSTKKLNPSVSKAVWIAGLGNLEITLVMAAICLPMFLYLFFSQWIPLSIITGLLVAELVMAFGLLANKPHRFLEQLHRRKTYVIGLQKIIPKSGYIPKPFKKKVKSGKRLIAAMEGQSDLKAVVDFAVSDVPVGGYLLQDHNHDLYVTFAWELGGINPALPLDEASRYNVSVDGGFRRLPGGALITFSYRSRSGELSEVEQLEVLKVNVATELEAALITSQQDSLRELDQAGQRQTKRLYAFLQVPCTTAEDMGALSQLYEQIAAKFSKARKTQLTDKATVMQALANAYQGGFAPINGALAKDFGHKVKPLSYQELITLDYLELHQHAEDLIIPQVLKLTTSTLKVIPLPVEGHTNYYLFRSQNGRPAVPVDRDAFLYLPVTKKYTGFYQVGKAIAYSHPEGAQLGQLHFLTDMLNKAGIHDYKITSQFGTTPSNVEAYLLRRSSRSQRREADENIAKGESSVRQQRKVGDAEAAELAVDSGERILTFGCLVQVYADHPDLLDQAFSKLQIQLGAIATGERCWHQGFTFWRQLQNWCTAELLKKPYNRQDKILSGNASGYIPAVKPETFDPRGIHFLTRTGMAPLHLDVFERQSHMAIYATTRMGKSVLMADVILTFYMRGLPAIVFDFPDPGTGLSTYSDMARLIKEVGGDAEYYDVVRESSNLLEMADIRGHLEEETMRLSTKLFQGQAIKLLVLGIQKAEAICTDVANFVDQSLDAFHQDTHIKRRYEAAWDSGFGTDGYQAMPTLLDFQDFFTEWAKEYRQKNPHEIDNRADEALALIARMLKARLTGKLRKAIAEPSTINPNARLIVFALTDVKDPVEASIYALAGYNALLRQSMSHPECAFFLDELPVLFKKPAIPDLVGDLCSNGLKWGCRVILSGQNIDAILATTAAEQILSTVNLTVIGGIQKIAIPGLTRVGVPEAMLGLYTSESRKPNKSSLMSSWMICSDKGIVETLYRPSDLLLALVANNPDEQKARKRFMAAYPNDPITALMEFAPLYRQAIRRGSPLSTLTPENSTDTRLGRLVGATSDSLAPIADWRSRHCLI